MHSLKRHEMAGITEIYTAKAMLDSHMVYGVKPGKKEGGEKDNSFRDVIFLSHILRNTMYLNCTSRCESHLPQPGKGGNLDKTSRETKEMSPPSGK